jgi:hypothetical protein
MAMVSYSFRHAFYRTNILPLGNILRGSVQLWTRVRNPCRGSSFGPTSWDQQTHISIRQCVDTNILGSILHGKDIMLHDGESAGLFVGSLARSMSRILT